MALRNAEEFFKNYSSRINGLMVFTKENPTITKKLKELQESFYYTIGTTSRAAEKHMKAIDKMYNKLSKLARVCKRPAIAQQQGFFARLFKKKTAEEQAIDLIDEIRFRVNEIKTAD